MPCELQDRETEETVDPKDTTTDWISGEYDVTGTIGGVTDDDWARARDAAIESAREKLLDKYTCVGTCEDGFCLVDVKVESNRAGRRVRRTVPNPPDSIPFQQGRRESERTFLTYEVKVSAFCRCARRSKPPVVSSGGTGVLIGGPGSGPLPPLPAPPNVAPPPFDFRPRLRWQFTPRWSLGLDLGWGGGFDWRWRPWLEGAGSGGTGGEGGPGEAGSGSGEGTEGR